MDPRHPGPANNAVLTEFVAISSSLPATAYIGYHDKAYVPARATFSGKVNKTIYRDEPKANVARYYANVTEGRFRTAPWLAPWKAT